MSERAPAPRTILSIGELLLDLIVSDGSTRLEDASAFDARPGGAPANVAVSLSRLGIPAAFCGVIGEDPFGTNLLERLRADGVDLSRIRRTGDADTTLAFAWKDARGDGHFRLLRMADRLLDEDDIARAGISECAAVVAGSVALSAEPSREAVTRAATIAAEAGIPVCFDVNLRPSLWPELQAARAACRPIVERATLLKLSLDDARALFDIGDDPDAAMDAISEFDRPFAVLTDGSRGSWFAAGGVSRYIPAFEVDAVEPTGAGDAFTGALIARLHARGWSSLSEEDTRYASAAGAIATTRRGAMEALPTAAEIEAFLAERPN
jgi:sugar/nucleoside kinase (ribokinase family)